MAWSLVFPTPLLTRFPFDHKDTTRHPDRRLPGPPQDLAMNFHNKPPVPHVPFVYRFTATALGASMWFFVSGRPRLRRDAGEWQSEDQNANGW